MLGLPGEIYDKYDRIVKGCRVCSTSMPPRLWELFVNGLRRTTVFRKESLVIRPSSPISLWFMAYYKFHGITPYPCGPRTPWPNRSETAVRLFKRTWSTMAKALADEGYAEKVTVRQAVKKVAWARNCQLTVSGYSPLEIATARRPPDLFDVETSTPEQLSAIILLQRIVQLTLDLQRIAMRAHQEARQSLHLRKDLARRVMPSDGPYQKGDRVFVWHKDESKKKSEGVWVRGIVLSQDGAMVLVEVHRAVLRVNQSKVRRDGDPWHDVAIPLTRL